MINRSYKCCKGIDVAKSKHSKECMVYQYWFFDNGSKYQDSICNGCHDLTMLFFNLSHVVLSLLKMFIFVVLFIKVVNLMQLIVRKFYAWWLQVYIKYIWMKLISQIEFLTIILINEKIYKDLTISFTRYVPRFSIKMLNLHYHELMGKMEECERKNIWWLKIICWIKH